VRHDLRNLTWLNEILVPARIGIDQALGVI
jgi:hypothetical protein